MITPSSLTSSSKIALVAPARKVALDDIICAIEFIKNKGYVPIYDERLFLSDNQFAGSDEERAATLQYYLDSPDIEAIMCVRGGYGTVRIIDRLDFSRFMQKPKWLIGYSDVTVLHNKLQSIGVESLHATMSINFPDNTTESLDSLFGILKGESLSYEIKSCERNICGEAEGEVVGGNISVLYSLLGSDIFPDTKDKILFLEDLDEYLYHIDRMMMALQRAGTLNDIRGLVVGGLTKMHDNAIPFGMTAKEIILEKVRDKNIPVCFGFPAGHIDDNRTLIFGRKAKLSCNAISASLCFQEAQR